VSASPSSIPFAGTATLTAILDATAGCNTGFTWSASGGTITPNGNSATFTAIPPTTPAIFTVTATSLADPTKSDTATVTVTAPVPCGQPNGTEIIHAAGDRFASETWAGDGVTHIVQGTIQIKGTAVLTVEACAIVKLGVNAGIFTFESGTLLSNGAGGGRNVLFTSSSTTGLRWGRLAARSATSLVDLRFTTIREGGEQPGFFNATLAGVGGGYLAPPAKVLRVISVAIEGSSGIGVYLGENAAFTDDSTALTVVNTGSNPVYASMRSLGSLPTGSYTGNARKDGADEILVIENGEVPENMTIKDLGVPYGVFVPSVNVRPLAPATAPVTLTLQPGVTMRFPRLGASPGALVTLGDAVAGTVGVLNAVGTGAPIVFTSGQATRGAGDWQGLWLANAPGSRLDNVQIEFAGAPNGITSNNCRPATTSTAAALIVGANSTLYVPPADLITNSTISSSAGHGINANWLAAGVSAPSLTATNTFSGLLPQPAACSQTFNGLTGGATCPSLGCTP
jgi:hypothetical protein